jgi:hypothetical protein
MVAAAPWARIWHGTGPPARSDGQLSTAEGTSLSYEVAELHPAGTAAPLSLLGRRDYVSHPRSYPRHARHHGTVPARHHCGAHLQPADDFADRPWHRQDQIMTCVVGRRPGDAVALAVCFCRVVSICAGCFVEGSGFGIGLLTRPHVCGRSGGDRSAERFGQRG